MTVNYTPQQAAAIFTRDVSIALAAGAGCGKTFVLTQRFLAELIHHPHRDTLRGLLAITFTDRAAREMRDRIREAVREQANRSDTQDFPLWNSLLQELETARIQTIHAFCAGLLKNHANELGIDPGFTVLDAPTTAGLRKEVLQAELIQRLKAGDPIVAEFILRYGLEGVQSIFNQLLQQRFLFSESARLAANESTLVELWRHEHQTDYLPSQLKALARSNGVEILFDTLRQNPTTSKSFETRRAELLILLERLRRTETLNLEDLLALREMAKLTGVRATHWSSEEVQETVKTHFASLRDAIDAISSNYLFPTEVAAQAAHFGCAAVEIVRHLLIRYDHIKQEQGVLDFDDLLLKTRDLLLNSEPVRNQLQNTFQFLMLDEFQDTDPVQTQIVEAICGERLKTGGLFLVGDVKQSIYRFRRADPAVFRRLRAQIPDKGQLALTNNFRSQQEILNFVNFVFAPEMPGEYDPLTAFDPRRLPPSEKVEFLWAQQVEKAKLSAAEKREIEADWIARRIRQLLDEETTCVRRKRVGENDPPIRQVEPGDIVILLRAFSNLGIYENALRQAGIDYYVVGGRAFYAQQEIFDIANLCHYLDDDTNTPALVGILRSPLFGLSDDTLLLIKQEYDDLNSAMESTAEAHLLETDQASCFYRARFLLTELKHRRFRDSIGDLLRYTVDQTGYDAALLTEFMGVRKVANLHKLLDLADQASQNGLIDLADFADQLIASIQEEEQEELAATHPETGNVVRLMTIHQSKGLEFPVVFVADLNRSKNSQKAGVVLSPRLGPLLKLPDSLRLEAEHPGLIIHRYHENQEEEAESIRLFYVATTRAADYLILSCYWHPDDKIDGPWLELLNRRFDLTTGLPRGDAYLGQLQNPGVEQTELPQIRVVMSQPEVTAQRQQQKILPLAEWPALLAEAEVVPPARLALPLEKITITGRRLTVSQLEVLSEQRQSASQTFFQTTTPTLSELPRGAEILGNLVHALLERLPEIDINHLKMEIERLAILNPDYQPAEIQRVAQQRVETLIASPLFEELRQSQVWYRELEFILKWPKPDQHSDLISGTIDCLIQDANNQWHLIDYKTGKLPETPAEVMHKFGIQLALYARAIQQVTGQLPRSTRIVQLAEEIRIVEIPYDTAMLADLLKQIDEILTETDVLTINHLD